MDPDIQKALDAGYSPQEIAAFLKQQGRPVPPELLSKMAPAATSVAPVAADGTSTPRANPARPTLAAAPLPGGLVLGGGATVYGTAKGAKKAVDVAARGVARKQLARAIEGSGGVQELIQRIQQFNQTGRGGMVTLSDLDPRLTAEADYVANANEPARVALTKLHNERQAGASGRLIADAEELAPGGYSAPRMMGDITRQSAADFAASEHGFQGLRDRNPALSPQASRQLVDFVQSPELERVWKDASQAGLVPPKPADAPNSFAVLQDMKERLDDATSEAFRKGRGQLGQRLGAARDKLVNLLVEEVPGYASVNAQYSTMKQREAALERGVEVWNDHTLQPIDLERELKTLTPEQLKAFRQGVLGGYLRTIENAQTSRNIADQLVKRGPALQKKLEIVFGGEAGFKAALTRFEQESAMARLGGAVHGSQTARRGAAQANAAGEVMEGLTDAAHVALHPTTGIPLVARGFVAKHLPTAVARHLAEPMTLRGSEALLEFLSKLPK